MNFLHIVMFCLTLLKTNNGKISYWEVKYGHMLNTKQNFSLLLIQVAEKNL